MSPSLKQRKGAVFYIGLLILHCIKKENLSYPIANKASRGGVLFAKPTAKIVWVVSALNCKFGIVSTILSVPVIRTSKSALPGDTFIFLVSSKNETLLN